jgi:hypothetical protein
VSVIHRSLMAGYSTILAVFAYLMFSATGPLLPDSTVIGYALAVTTLTLLGLGVTLFRGRVPRRAKEQLVAEFWARGATSVSAVVLWAVVEAAGTLGLVGWFLSGNLVALAAGLGALGALVVHSPRQLAGE